MNIQIRKVILPVAYTLALFLGMVATCSHANPHYRTEVNRVSPHFYRTLLTNDTIMPNKPWGAQLHCRQAGMTANIAMLHRQQKKT